MTLNFPIVSKLINFDRLIIMYLKQKTFLITICRKLSSFNHIVLYIDMMSLAFPKQSILRFDYTKFLKQKSLIKILNFYDLFKSKNKNTCLKEIKTEKQTLHSYQSKLKQIFLLYIIPLFFSAQVSYFKYIYVYMYNV